MPRKYITPHERIESFAWKKYPRAILSHLIGGKVCTVQELRKLGGKTPFYTKTVRYWILRLVQHGYVKEAIDLKADGRCKFYGIPPEKKGMVVELLQRIPGDEMECPRLP